ncbi:MAG: PadR family transcriptional regulator [Pseudomonadota bacterium]
MSLRFAILTALLDEELSGYDLARDFDHSLGFFWQASHQQIYRELKKLGEMSWLSSRSLKQPGRPDRVIYAMTPDGRQALDEWVLGGDRMRMHEIRDDFYIKLYNTSEENLEHILSSLHDRGQWMRERLALYEKIRERRYAEPEKLSLRRQGVYLALLAGIKSCQFYIAWCKEAKSLLQRGADNSLLPQYSELSSPELVDTA